MRRFLVLALVLATGLPVVADEVMLANGDKLTGKVKELGGGKLAIETPHSGVVLVDWAQVKSVATDENVKVKLDSGEVIEGKLSAGEAGKLRISSASVSAPVDIDPAKVTRINEPPAEWHGFLELGFRATGGNTHNQTAYVAAQLLRETDRDRFLIRANFNYGRSEGITNAQSAYGQIKYDYKFTSRLYGFVSEELTHDKFRDLRIGTMTSLGAGLIIVKEEKIESWVEAGVAYATNDFYALQKDEGHLAGRLHHHFKVSLPFGIDFTNDVTFYPNFERMTDWQLHEEAFLSAGLGKGWTARAGVILDYDHEVSALRKKHDVIYVLTIGYKF